MFSAQSSTGLHRAPVCKALLGATVGSSLLLQFPLQQYRPYFGYTQRHVFDDHQIWRVLSSKLAFLDIKDLVLCSVLVYTFRIFERRYGSRKFVSHVLGAGLIAILLEVAALYVCRMLHVSLDPLPSGPLCFIYPLFIPYFCNIPRVTMSHIFGIPVTGKSITYIFGLQVASTSLESLLVAVCGMVAGAMWRINILRIQSVITVPKMVSDLFKSTLGRLLDTSNMIEQNTQTVGATLELQRQENMEQIEQQMIWQSLQNSQVNGRNIVIGRPQPQNLVNGPGLFGGGNNNIQEGLQHQNSDSEDEVADETEISEDQVQLLVDMGFRQDEVRHALQMSNNDVSMATNVLLQQS